MAFTSDTTIYQAFTIVGIEGDPEEEGTQAAGLAVILGANRISKVIDLGELPPDVFSSYVAPWKFAGVPASPLLRSKAEKMGRLARALLTCTSTATTTGTEGIMNRKIKLSKVLNQTDDTDIEAHTRDARTHFGRFEATFGEDERPDNDEAPDPVRSSL